MVILFVVACARGDERALPAKGPVEQATFYREMILLRLFPSESLENVLDLGFLGGAKPGMSLGEIEAVRGAVVRTTKRGADTIYEFQSSTGTLEIEERYISSSDGLSGTKWELYYRPSVPLDAEAVGPTIGQYIRQLDKGTGQIVVSPANDSGGATLEVRSGKVERIFLAEPHALGPLIGAKTPPVS